MEGLPATVAEELQALTYRERAVAYLQVGADLTLVGAGGHLGAYGLAGLRLGEPAAEQAFFLEGLLPPVETRFIVQTTKHALESNTLQRNYFECWQGLNHRFTPPGRQ